MGEAEEAKSGQERVSCERHVCDAFVAVVAVEAGYLLWNERSSASRLATFKSLTEYLCEEEICLFVNDSVNSLLSVEGM